MTKFLSNPCVTLTQLKIEDDIKKPTTSKVTYLIFEHTNATKQTNAY